LSVIALFGVIGGVIGYLTNVLAIKMLFYPVEKKCITPGVCIQGVIPGKKKELAKRLGEVFSTYAATTDVIDKYWVRIEESFKQTIQEIIVEKTSSMKVRIPIIQDAIPSLAASIADAFAPYLRKLGQQASQSINFAEIIEEEFEKLDIEDLEEIFHRIAGKELRFVEAMGFILGFIVGLVEGIVAVLISI
jgi:uncharacterized membrane protein YheB (UPF0754 family)